MLAIRDPIGSGHLWPDSHWSFLARMSLVISVSVIHLEKVKTEGLTPHFNRGALEDDKLYTVRHRVDPTR